MIMIGLLVVGFACNELIRPVHPRFHEPGTTTTQTSRAEASA